MLRLIISLFRLLRVTRECINLSSLTRTKRKTVKTVAASLNNQESRRMTTWK